MTQTRERLIDAGLDLFYQNSFHAVGIDSIIRQVGTTKTTFYNHFESKEDLALAAFRNEMHPGVSNCPRCSSKEPGAVRMATWLELSIRSWPSLRSDVRHPTCSFAMLSG